MNVSTFCTRALKSTYRISTLQMLPHCSLVSALLVVVMSRLFVGRVADAINVSCHQCSSMTHAGCGSVLNKTINTPSACAFNINMCVNILVRVDECTTHMNNTESRRFDREMVVSGRGCNWSKVGHQFRVYRCGRLQGTMVSERSAEAAAVQGETT
jgi:hypothetical protein